MNTLLKFSKKPSSLENIKFGKLLQKMLQKC